MDDQCQECGPKEREIALLEKMRVDLMAMNDSLIKVNLQVGQERDDLNLENGRLRALLREFCDKGHSIEREARARAALQPSGG